MNITISRISNGWVLAVASPKGQTAFFYVTYEEVLSELESIMKPESQNVHPMDGGKNRQ